LEEKKAQQWEIGSGHLGDRPELPVMRNRMGKNQ
jgi:hypothetical protein